jgi:hypothetical protein
MLGLVLAAALTQEQCAMAADAAYGIMMMRQSGASIFETMSLTGGVEVLELLTIEAYKIPRMRSQNAQDIVAYQFSDQTYETCMAGRRDAS